MSDPVIRTRVAAELGSEHLFHGYRVFAELAGAETFSGLTALAIVGRRLDEAERLVLDDIACVMALADPRVWPLKISRVLASYGSFVLGCFAGSLCLEEAVIGPWSCGLAARVLSDFATELGPRVGDDDSVRDAVRQRLARDERLPGFGVPLRNVDERLVALAACMKRRGRDEMPNWKLMVGVSDALRRSHGLEPNIAMGLAAAALDLGFAPDEIGPLMVSLLQPTFIANALEGAQQQSAFLREMPREHVRYVGAPPRTSPRALALAARPSAAKHSQSPP